MIDSLRDGSACPVFCKTLPFSGLNGGHVLNVSHELFQITHKSFSTSEKSIENNCSIKTGEQRWNRCLIINNTLSHLGADKLQWKLTILKDISL